MIDFNKLLEQLEMTNNENKETTQSVFGAGNFDETPFINFDKNVNNNTLKLRFLVNEPDQVVNGYGKPQYNFEVVNMDTEHIGVHSITSMRYMRALEDHIPLMDKALCVKRSGEGMETDYTVTLI